MDNGGTRTGLEDTRPSGIVAPMKTRPFQGWTLVAVWITAGLAIWFLASIAGNVDRWMSVNQHLSGWFQGVGGIAAVAAAFIVAGIQMRAQQAAERERDRLDRTHKLHAAVVLFSAATSDAIGIARESIHSSGWQAKVANMADSTASDLGQIGPFDLPDPFLMHQCGTIKTAFILIAQETGVKYVLGNAEKGQVQTRANFLHVLAQAATVHAEALLDLSMNAEEKAEFAKGKELMKNVRRRLGIPTVTDS